MTYSRFLLVFIVLPILVLAVLLALRARTLPRPSPLGSVGRASAALLASLIVVATLYTFPWDNHLIASHVWSYNPALVSGITLGWIPLEELLFFPLQTLLVALWLFWLAPPPATPAAKVRPSRCVRLIATLIASCVWLVALVMLLAGWPQATYLGWELAWALPPLILQLCVGAGILWRDSHLLVAAIAPAMLYLSAADALAIHMGIWTIDPHQSTGLLIGGTLPLEELVFFLLTTTLVTAGLHLGRSLAPLVRPRGITMLRLSSSRRQP
ncbi:MAG TPA: lycopene cyclase domain-containing protein [Ktedonobacterales bacterium]